MTSVAKRMSTISACIDSCPRCFSCSRMCSNLSEANNKTSLFGIRKKYRLLIKWGELSNASKSSFSSCSLSFSFFANAKRAPDTFYKRRKQYPAEMYDTYIHNIEQRRQTKFKVHRLRDPARWSRVSVLILLRKQATHKWWSLTKTFHFLVSAFYPRDIADLGLA